MKFLSFLFAIYFLTLAVMPCVDEECTDKENTSATPVPSDNSDNCQDTHEDEACSPLCMCHCCGGGITLISDVENNTILFNSSEINSLYSFENISGISIPVWQPPKV